MLHEAYGDNNAVGAPARGNKVKLPMVMPSVDKVTPENKGLGRWVKKYGKNSSFTITDKLDGMSMLIYREGDTLKAATRGNGEVGTDITWVLDYLRLPLNKVKTGEKIRGELILPKKEWDKIKKVHTKFTSSRNFVTGAVSRKEESKSHYKSIKFLAFQYRKNEVRYSQCFQLELLKKKGFDTPWSVTVNEKSVNDEEMSRLFRERIQDSRYEIDGLVLANDNSMEEEEKGEVSNPKHKKAFKMLLNEHKTRVIRVEWSPSINGLLKPVVIVEPVKVDGATIRKVTGHNARYVAQGGIAEGAVIMITRSGAVIPKVTRVINKSSKSPLPPGKDWEWNENKVEIVTRKESKTIKVKRLEHFFVSIGFKNFRYNTIDKLYDHGFNTIKRVCSACAGELVKIKGFGEKQATALLEQIKEREENGISLVDAMLASGCFTGLGKKSLRQIVDLFPDVMEKVHDLAEVKGFGEIVARRFNEGMKHFKKFVKDELCFRINRPVKKKTKRKENKDVMKIVVSGFRPNGEEKKQLEQRGMKVMSSINGGTKMLVVKDTESNSNKIKTARELGIPIVSREEMFS